MRTDDRPAPPDLGPVIPILRASGGDRVRAVVETLAEAGVRSIELTLTTPGALDGLREARASLPASVVLGMGTALSAADVRDAVAAGAGFVVSPVASAEVVEAALLAGVPAIPGAFTPTEMLAMHRAGAAAVKVFPAGRLGPAYIADVLAPLPMLRLVPTGGIGLADAPAYLAAGAWAVGIGSALTGDALRGGSLGELAARCRDLVAVASAARRDSGVGR